MLNLEHLVYHNTGDPEPGQLTLMRPFGPALGHTKLPDEIIDAFNADIDKGTDGATCSAKLVKLDVEYQLADEGVHPDGSSKVQVAAKKVALRDLPPTAQSHLAGLNDTDAITAYDPVA